MRKLGLVLLLGACGGDQKTDTDSDTPVTILDGEPCTEDLECDFGYICGADDICEYGDRDNSFDDAAEIRFNEDAEGVIVPGGDIDYFKFETLSPGQWVSIQTLNERTETDDLDTVVRLFQSNGQEHAFADNFDIYRISGADSRVIAYLPTAGEWFVTVEDASTFYAADESRGSEDYTYTLQLTSFTGVVTESEPLVVELERGTQIASRAVLLATEGDEDEIVLEVPYDDRVVEISGASGIPGSAVTANVEVLRDSETLAEQTDLGDGNYAQILSSEAGRYTLRMSDAAGGGSQDHWFVVYMRTYEEDGIVTFWGDTTYEYEAEPNDDAATASPSNQLSESTGTGLDYEANYVEGIIDAAGDEDWYAFTVPNGQRTLTIRCYADRFGSLADIAIEVLDDEGNVVADATEYADFTAPQAFNIELESSGAYNLRVFAEDDLAGAAAFYRCQMLRTDWTVAE
jgi:hypothetical protein